MRKRKEEIELTKSVVVVCCPPIDGARGIRTGVPAPINGKDSFIFDMSTSDCSNGDMVIGSEVISVIGACGLGECFFSYPLARKSSITSVLSPFV